MIIEQNQKDIVVTMQKNGLTEEEISKYLSLDINKVKEILKN